MRRLTITAIALAMLVAVPAQATEPADFQGAAAALDPTDPWERLLKAGLMREFEQLRLDLLRRITPAGQDPGKVVEAWLADNQALVARVAAPIARARSAGGVTVPMLAHLAAQARAVLG